jgi:fluoride exporter
MKGLEFVFLGVGGILGTFLRYKILETQILFHFIPVNTLIVNVLGSFILGIFLVTSIHYNIDGRYALFAAVGFCGSLTTFSAFALDNSTLLDNSQYGIMFVNVIANVGLAIGALFAGKTLMNSILN